MSNHSFVIEAQLAATAQPGDRLRIEGAEAHHAVNVKRVRSGERLDLLNGQGRRVVIEVIGTDKQGMDVQVLEIVDEAPPTHPIGLIQALAKSDRDLQAVEAGVELGISAVRPWQADRSIVRWSGGKTEKALAKWRAQVRSAQKQSRRSFEPIVHEPLNSKSLAREVQGLVNGGELVLVMHEAADTPLGQLVDNWRQGQQSPAGVWIIVGPEGGISDTELEQLTQAGARAVVLGEHVLRASTAGPAAVVLVRHLLGDI